MSTTSKPAPKKLLVHLGYDQDAVDPMTVKVRWTDPRPSRWLCTTQAWKWDDGRCDALVVVATIDGQSSAYIVVRVGKKVHVLEGSLHSAMKELGFNPADYITIGRDDYVAWEFLKPATRRALQRAATRGAARLTKEQVAEIGSDCVSIPTPAKLAILGVGAMQDGQLGAWTEG